MNAHRIRGIVAALSLGAACLLSACGGVDRDVAHLVTIEQGVYGQTTYYKDSQPSALEYASYSLDIYEAPREESAPVAQVTSGEMGFYEVALSPGDFEICANGDECQPFTVPANERIRLDYEAGEFRWHAPEDP